MKSELLKALGLAREGKADQIEDAKLREAAVQAEAQRQAQDKSEAAEASETQKAEAEAQAQESNQVGAVNSVLAGFGLSSKFKVVPVDEAPDGAGAGAHGSAPEAPKVPPGPQVPAAGAFPLVGAAFGGTLAAAIGMGRSAGLDAKGIVAAVERAGSKPLSESPFLAHEAAQACLSAACEKEQALPGSSAQETPDGTNLALGNMLVEKAKSLAAKAK